MPTAATHLSIRYGQRRIDTRVPDGCTVQVVGRKRGDGRAAGEVLAEACATPLGGSRLDEFLRGARRPLIVINDGTRSTPTAAMLDHVLPLAQECEDWGLIVATGLHRKPTERELDVILGRHAASVRARLLVHDGYDKDDLVTVDTPAGPVYLNRAVVDADRLILLNSVEPHFFAGYTGGRKSIVPGLAGHDSVQASHAGAMTVDAAPLRVDGNPVRQYIQASTERLADKVWALQVVLDRDDRVVAAFAGHVDRAFEAAAREADHYYAVALAQQFDILIAAVHPPLDVNLYQAQKAWELSCQGVRDGGVLIVTSPCIESVGSPFYQRLSEEFPKQEDWHTLATRPYTMGLHKLVRTARARSRINLMAVTEMEPGQIERFGYEPAESVAEALDLALAQTGRPARILVVEDAALTTLISGNTENQSVARPGARRL